MDYYKGNLATLQKATIIHKMPFSWPYRHAPHESIWGVTSSQANFCEEDYIVTAYIAEFINTLTNLVLQMYYMLIDVSPDVEVVYYAYHGVKSNSNRKDAILRNLPYLGIAAVGLGSGIFHATLKNYTQWCDDLSMLLAVATVTHRVFTFDKSLTYTVVFGIILTLAMTTFSVWHCVMDELVMHSVLFGIMIAFVGTKTRSIIKARVSDPVVQKDVRNMATWGAVIFVSGFIIWNIDTVICGQLTTVKRTIGMPWSFLLELHGWWHLFTGLGAYIFIALVEYLTSEEAGQSLGSRFAWPVSFFITGHGPSIPKHADSWKPNGNGNGNGMSKLNGNGCSKRMSRVNGNGKNS